MSYLSLLKSLPNNLRQPAGIAFIASIGVHGLVGFSLPLLSSSQTDTPDQQQKVKVVELSPDQVQRLPQSVLPQQQTASIPVPGNQLPANFFRPGAANGKNPGFSLVPLPGFPNLYRLPSGMNNYNQAPYMIPAPLSQGAPARNPSGLGQQARQRPASPLFDNDILSRDTPWSTASTAWNNITPDSPNLRISGNPAPSPTPSSSPSPQASPTTPASPQSPGLVPIAVGSPSPSPTATPASPSATPSSPSTDPGLLAYNSEGTSPGETSSELSKWLEQAQSNGMVPESGSSPWQSLPVKISAPPEARPIVEKAERPIRVILGVLVDKDGKLMEDPRLLQKSGYKLLDDAARDAMKNYAYSSTGANIPYLITLEFTL